jgi:hypothetical protein
MNTFFKHDAATMRRVSHRHHDLLNDPISYRAAFRFRVMPAWAAEIAACICGLEGE